MKTSKYLIKTAPPINSILLCLLIILLIIESFSNKVWLVYTLPICAIYYVHFCRYCCIVIITEKNLVIKYIAPWNRVINIKIENIKSVDYEKGFYDILSSKTRGGIFVFPQYCYDRLIVHQDDSEKPIIYLNINTIIYGFDKILKLFSQLKLLKVA